MAALIMENSMKLPKKKKKKKKQLKIELPLEPTILLLGI